MAGLLAAGQLARYFERVTLVERDRLEDNPQPRKGVPQGTQTHILLRRGLDIVSDIFPGIPVELRVAGAQVLDLSADCEWFIAGIWRKRIDSGVRMYSQTRPLFEWKVRAKLAAMPRVRILDGHELSGFLTSEGRITGVKVREPGGEQETVLEADLVVDASGRGSRTPQWLEAAGYPRVEESHLKVDVGYATRLYRPSPDADAAWRALIVSADLPRTRRSGSIVPIEGGLWSVTMCGWLKDGPPTDDAGFLAYARSLAQPHFHEALRSAEPVSPIRGYRFAHSQWRHYERMARLPEGLLVLGDAYCSFNPMYGQGITVSALQVELLGECLREGLQGLPGRYYPRVSKLLKLPWSMGTSEDLRLPEVEGSRQPGMGLLYWYGDHFQRLTAVDDEAIRTFVQVMHMLKPPTAMFSPRLLLKTLTRRPSGEGLNKGPLLRSTPEPEPASESASAA
jgi:2-polyprenyl-6-methoxyphenol hydroxylase-like FAD-dependent oxidoreductase